ncbi:MAG TPA: MFS transporter, partial [Dehalococcoidales bacterium]|nr:MFS transporter [Dehalococcoidales bacterium]
MLHYAVTPNIKAVFPVLGLSIFSSMLGLGIIAPLLPIYAENLGASGFWVGVIFAGYAISRTILQPFAGRLSDRRGKKLVMSVGLFIFALSSFAYVLADSVAVLLVIRLLQGAAACMVQPMAQAYLGDITPAGEEGKWMGILNTTFFAGWGGGPLMGGLLAQYFGMDAAFYAMGGLNCLAFLGAALFLPEISRGRRMTEERSSFREAMASRRTRGLFSLNMGISGSRAIVLSFLPIFGAVFLGLRPSFIGTILTVVVIGAAVIQLYTGRLADRFNRRLIVVTGGLGVVLAMALVPSAGGFWPLLVFLAISTGADAVILPSATAMVVEEGRKYGMGMAMAVFSMGMGAGQSIAPILAGAVADWLGVRAAFYFSAVFVVLCTLAFV